MSDKREYSMKFKLTLAIVIIYSIIRIIIAQFEVIKGEAKWSSITDIEVMIISLLASLSLFYVAIGFESGSRNRNLLVLLGLGYFLWFLGETTWAYYDLATSKDPFPSLADVFYLLAYLPIILAITWKSRTTIISPEKKRIILMMTIVILFVVLSSIYVIQPILEDDTLSALEKYVSVAYPILDIALLFAVSFLLAKYAGGKMEKAWILFSISIFMTAFADSYFAYEEWNELYSSYSLSNSLFIVAYLLILPFSILFKETYH